MNRDKLIKRLGRERNMLKGTINSQLKRIHEQAKNLSLINDYHKRSIKIIKKELRQQELEFLETNYANFTWEGLQRSIKPLQKRMKVLKKKLGLETK